MADFAVWRRHFAVFTFKFLQIAHTHYQTIVKRHIPAIRRSADIDMNIFNLVRTGKFAGLRRTGKLKIPVFKISAVPFGRMLSGLFVIAGRLLRRRNRQSAKLGKIYLCAVRTAQPAKNRIFKSYISNTFFVCFKRRISCSIFSILSSAIFTKSLTISPVSSSVRP